MREREKERGSDGERQRDREWQRESDREIDRERWRGVIRIKVEREASSKNTLIRII